MIGGIVTDDGSPTILIALAGRDWPAVIDTGFNSGLELPETLRPYVNARFSLPMRYWLAGGQTVVQDTYSVDFPFDGCPVTTEATFVPSDTILVGTAMLRGYRLEIDFVACTVKLERVATP